MAENGGWGEEGVRIRFSTEGGEEVIRTLREIQGSIDKLGSQQAATATAALATAISTTYTAFMQAKEYVQSYLNALIAVRAEHEALEIRLASLYERQMGWTNAINEARVSLEKLQSTGTSFDETRLMQVFQTLRLTVGGTREELHQLTQQIAQVAELRGLSPERMVMMLRQGIERGQFPGGMRGGGIPQVFAEMGLDPKALSEAADKMDYLLGRLKPTAEAADALRGSWKVLANDTTQLKNDLIDMIAKGFDPARRSIRAVVDAANDPANKSALSNFADMIARINQGVYAGLLKAGTTWVGTGLTLVGGLLGHPEWGTGFYQRRYGNIDPMVYGPTPTTPGMMPGHDRTPPSFDEQQFKEYRQNWEDMVRKYSQEQRLAGLDGIRKQLAEIGFSAANARIEIDRLWDKLPGEIKGRLRQLGYGPEQLKAEVGETEAIQKQRAWEAEFERQAKAQQKAIDDSIKNENFYFSTIKSMRRGATNDAIEIIEEETRAQLEALDEQEAAAIRYFLTGTRLLEDHEEEIRGIEDAAQAKRDALAKNQAERQQMLLSAQEGNWDDYFDHLQMRSIEAHENIFAATQRNLQQTAQAARDGAQTAAQGLDAGVRTILASMKSYGQDVADTLTSLWGNLTRTFEDTFYSVLSNRFDSIGDIFKNLFDSILLDWSKMLTEMLKRWLITGDAMGNGQGTGGWLSSLLGIPNYTGTTGVQMPMSTIYNPNGTYSGGLLMPVQGGSGNAELQRYAAWAAAAYMLGTAISNSSQTNTGTVGYGIGERNFGGNGGQFGAYASAGLMVAGSFGYTNLYADIVGAVIMLVGAIVSIIQGPLEAKIYGGEFSSYQRTTGSGVAARALDLYGLSGLGDRAGFAAGTQSVISKYLLRALGFEVHAGSAEDLTKDIERLLTQIMPTEMMHELFGQRPGGGRDYAGISGGSSYTGSTVTGEGPITQMLLGLGFTYRKIQEIADSIDTMTIEEFQKKLTMIVEVAVGFATNIKRLGWTSGEIEADITSQSKTTTQSFAESAKTLTQMAKELKLYTGDDQLQKAKELIDLVNQRWADEEAAIKAILDLIEELTAMIDAASTSMQTTMRLLGWVSAGGNQTDFLVNEGLTKIFGPSMGAPWRNPGAGISGTGGIMERIEGATPEELPSLVREAVALIQETFNLLVQRLQQILALQKQNNELVFAFGQTGPEMWAAPGQMGPLGTGTTTSDLGFMLNKARTTSGQEQLDWITRLQNAAAQRYQEELAMISQIQQNMKDLARSVEQQKWGFQFEAAGVSGGKPAQAEMIINRLKMLMGSIGAATSPEQLAAITGEIQSLTGQFWSMSNKGPDALAYVTRILDEMQRLADEQYGKLFAQVVKDNDIIKQMLIDAGKLLTDAEKKTRDQIKDLGDAMERLKIIVDEKLHQSIEDIVATNAPLLQALKDAAPLITGAGTAMRDAGGAADDLKRKFWDLRDAIDDLGFWPRTNPVMAIRNNPGLTASRTGNGTV